MKKIGFTSGIMYKKISPVSPEIFNILAQISTDAVEINLIGNKHLGLVDSVIDHINRFETISIHAPCIRYSNNTKSATTLLSLDEMCRKHNINCVVFHPDTIVDWGLLSNYKIPIAMENMDHHKKFGTSVQDMHKVFSQIDCGFVLDINHTYSNDPSMGLAKDLLDNFGDRLVEIHASGFTKYHEPLFQTGQDYILDAVKDLDVPIILEATFQDIRDLQKEYDYVKNYLQ